MNSETSDASNQNLVENDKSNLSNSSKAEILINAIQIVLIIISIVGALAIYHFTVVQKAAQKFALLDVSEVIGIKQMEIAELSTRKGVSDSDREKIYSMITTFAKDIEIAVADIQQECNCTLLVRSAVVKTSAAEDLTPVLKARLGLDKSAIDLQASLRKNTGASAESSLDAKSPVPPFEPTK